MTKTHVVACVVKHRGRILILRRSQEVEVYKDKWSGISGYIGDRELPEAAYEEIRDETGLRKMDLEFIRELKPIEFSGGGRDWVIHVYLFKSKTKNVKIGSEHTEYKWMPPEEVENYDTIPKFEQVLELLDL